MAQIIDGKAIAADIRREIAADVAALSSDHNLVPGLAVVIVGSRKDSQTYVQMKRKACAEVGIRSVDIDLPEDISESALVAEVHRLNADPAVHGIVSHQNQMMPFLVSRQFLVSRLKYVSLLVL